MKFSEIISGLLEGQCFRRKHWKNKVIVRQVPSTVPKEVVPKMTSLPPDIKSVLSMFKDSCSISYHDQVIILSNVDDSENEVTATYYIPTWEDIFANDWSRIY